MSRSWPGCDWWGCGCWQIGSSSPPPLWRSGVHCWPLHDCMTVHDNVAGDHSIINYQLPHHTWCSVNCLRVNYDYPNTIWDYLWTECNKSMHNIQISSYWKGRCYCYHFLLTRLYFVDIKVKVSMLRLLSRDNIEMSKYRNADVDAIVMYSIANARQWRNLVSIMKFLTTKRCSMMSVITVAVVAIMSLCAATCRHPPPVGTVMKSWGMIILVL